MSSEDSTKPVLALPPAEGHQALPPPLAPPALPPVSGASSVRRRPRRLVWIMLLCVLALLGYFITTRHAATTAASGGKGGKAGKQGAASAIPVVGAMAARGNVPVYLAGLGTVTAFNTVTVRTRVDGELVNIFFQEGQLVRQGDALAEIDPRPYQVQLEQAEGQMAKDQATLNNARTDLVRYEVLYKQDAVPQQQLATQQATVVQDEGVIKSDQGAIDNAKLQLTYCHITSPLTGRIGLRLVDRGNIVHAADTNGLLVITQLQPIALIFNISEDYLPQVRTKLQQGFAFPVEAWNRDLTSKIASGTLETIDNQVDSATGTVKFKATFNNQDNTLFPNQFVNARLLVDTKRGVVIIPSAAIQRSEDSTFVWVVNPDMTVQVRNVKTSVSEADRTAIDSGLMPGEMVVTDGIDRLQPGVIVAIKTEGAGPSAAERPAKASGQNTKGQP